MKIMGLLVLGLFLSIGIRADEAPAYENEGNPDEAPTLPLTGEDLKFMKGKTAREFFANRATPSPCRTSFATQFEIFRKAKVALADLVKQSAGAARIDAQEKVTVDARKELMKFMSECGDCAARDTETRKVKKGVSGTEVWHISHGSCQLPEKDPAKLKQAFEALRTSLQHIKQFPKKDGGAHYILDLVGVDFEGKKFLPDLDKLETSPKYAMIAIRGPEIVLPLGFRYFFKSEWETLEKDGRSHYVMTGNSVPPLGFPEYSVKDVAASGTSKTVKALVMNKVLAQWQLHSDGYIRYYTAGDFSQVGAFDFVKNTAREVMLDTVTNYYERGLAAAR